MPALQISASQLSATSDQRSPSTMLMVAVANVARPDNLLCNRSKHADALKTLLRGIRDRVSDIGGSRLESYFHSGWEPSLNGNLGR